ncbi:TetR/AcrR family transcriptional regulator [Pseudonocardia adelaidensis]|uniref:HTH tetR-type domain-containing protein n=1 Tax=Pseudonocardia adelaidensis TaxID=648754 RepID=A0ABP9NCL4_9PSEU
MQGTRGPGRRAGLSRDRVLDAATDVIAEHGAVTMRAVAQRLGVAPNTLYSHVADKTELVDGVLDRVLAQVEAPGPDPGGDPGDAIHRLMTSTHDVLLRHPQLLPAFLTRQGARGENAHRLGAVMLEHLAAAGITGDAAREALRVLIVYTIGFAAFDGAPEERPVPGSELRDNFDRGLRWLIAGITAGEAPDRRSESLR